MHSASSMNSSFLPPFADIHNIAFHKKDVRIHANSIEIKGIGILISGPGGSGKSFLTQKLLETMEESYLIADDQVILSPNDQKLIATTPSILQGKLHLRGHGFFNPAFKVQTHIDHCFELTQSSSYDIMATFTRLHQFIQHAFIKGWPKTPHTLTLCQISRPLYR